MDLHQLTIIRTKHKVSQFKYHLNINDIPLVNIISQEYEKTGGEEPLLGMFIGGFNKSLLTYAHVNDSKKLNQIKSEISHNYHQLITGGNRISLLVCDECKDISCGLISANMNISKEKYVIWDSFAYQSSIELQDTEFLQNLKFIFEAKEYIEVLNHTKEEILKEFTTNQT